MYSIGWRGYLLLAVALVLTVALAAALLWLAVGLAVIAALAAFNYVYLPSIAARLRLPTVALAGLLLPILLGIGWVAASQTGLIWAGVIWLGGVAAPRVAAYILARRFRTVLQTVADRTRVASSETAMPTGARVGTACPNCGLVTFAEPGAGPQRCPRCQSMLPPS